MPKDIQCPALLAAVVTVPPTRGITRAGQHQAPRRAGIERIIVNNEHHKAFL